LVWCWGQAAGEAAAEVGAAIFQEEENIKSISYDFKEATMNKQKTNLKNPQRL